MLLLSLIVLILMGGRGGVDGTGPGALCNTEQYSSQSTRMQKEENQGSEEATGTEQ